MHVLILYGSLEGQTEKISQRIAEVIRNKGHQVTTLPAENMTGENLPGDFTAAIVGGSIHMGKYPGYVKTFVNKQRDWLNNIPSAFFTVCMGINSQKKKSKQQAVHYGEQFLEETGWQPTLSETFAGAVKYTQYNYITRFIMKMISKKEGGSTDTSRDHEYTDWDKVERFAESFTDEIS